ncbi:MFS transporter [Sphingomonas sp. RB3P16]|uniref:MFS transporter n=1 Tax=Parasphingomonas frigoris TaxID=3096163 RepID=UPI002FC918F4
MPPLDADAMTARQKSLAFFTLISALVLEIVDTTIVNTALPSIQHDFAASAVLLQWVVAGYSLSFAVLLILGGRLGDLFGYRAMFLLGVGGFTLGSLLCGLAQDALQLVIARLVQGAAGAIMAPQVLALMQVMYAPLERVGKLSWFGVIGGLSAILGPILGGLLIAANLFGTGWRAVFLINVPIGALALVAAWYLLPRARSARAAGVDAVGTLLMGAGLAALLLPLVRERDAVWAWWNWASLALGPLLLLLGWHYLKRRVASGRPAVFDPALFAVATFRQGLLIAVSFSAGMTGFLFLFAYTLQSVLGYSPLRAGMTHTPFSIGVMIGIGLIGRRLVPRYGRWVLVGGAAILAASVGFIMLWILGGGAQTVLLVPVLLAAGVGMGMLSGPIPPIAVARIDRAHAGAASGLLKTSQQLGSALGVALVGAAYFAASGVVGVPPILAALALIETLFVICAIAAVLLPRDVFPKPDGATVDVRVPAV